MKNNRLIYSIMILGISLGLVACGKNNEDYYIDESYEDFEEFVQENPEEEYINITPEVVLVTDLADDSLMPCNFMEERVMKTEFDSQQEIIDGLTEGEGYAYISLKGATEKVLVISDEFFDMGDKKCAIMAYPYIKNDEGKYVCGSVFSSNSTATPIAVSKDGLVYCATHDTIEKMCISKDTNGIMDMVYLYMDIVSEEPSYGGFVRTENVCNKDGEPVAADDSSFYDAAFEEYNECEPIAFILVE